MKTTKSSKKDVAKKTATPKAPKTEAIKVKPTDDVAKAVAAVTTGDLAKGVEVPMPAKKAGKAMKAGEIVEAMTTKGYWTSPGGKTPAATIYAAIITHIAKKGTDSMFARGEVKGTFVATAAAGQPAQAKSVQVVTVPGKKA